LNRFPVHLCLLRCALGTVCPQLAHFESFEFQYFKLPFSQLGQLKLIVSLGLAAEKIKGFA